MRRISDLIKWFILTVLILTVLLLNIYLLLHYSHHHALSRPGAEPQSANDNSPQTEESNPIPKIIHLMWSERLVPNNQLKFVKKWQELNPDWTIWFWTDSDFDKLLQTKYPSMTDIYRREMQPHDRIVNRRYFIINQYGGLWADLDVEPLKPISPLLKGKTCLLSQEPLVHARLGWRIDMMIGSAIFACQPKHPYFQLVINLFRVNAKDPHTLAASGSVMLSRVYFRYKEITSKFPSASKSALPVADPEIFMPRTSESYLAMLRTDCQKQDEVSHIREPFCKILKPLNFEKESIPATSYTVHHFYRTWARGPAPDKSTTNKQDIFEVAKVEKPKL